MVTVYTTHYGKGESLEWMIFTNTFPSHILVDRVDFTNFCIYVEFLCFPVISQVS